MPQRKRRFTSLSAAARSPRTVVDLRARPGVPSALDSALGAFRSECDAAIGVLRAALGRLGAAAESDPLRPQEVSRRFGINKNLTWKIARVLLATDALEAIPMIPGPEGIEIYLRAFESKDTLRAHTAAVREALTQFEGVIARHFGDRAQLDVVLDGLRADGNLESSRRMAFKGMSGVFGLRARVRLTVHMLFPSADTPGVGDVAQLVGLAGLQRLRPIGALPVFRTTGGSPANSRVMAPLVRTAERNDSDFLLREFSNFPSATVHTREFGGQKILELSEGPIGRVGESDIFFGTLLKGTMALRRTPDESSHEFVTNVSVPSESLVLDFYCHRELVGTEAMTATVHSTLGQPLSSDAVQREQSRMPMDLSPAVLEQLHEAPPIPAMPRYPQMVAQAFDAVAQDIRDFRLVRVCADFPPAPSAVLVRWMLPE
ncbi:MAG: hypothetical protein RL354_87 [Planctomycetota bacterium]